jgi:hypothetical protein
MKISFSMSEYVSQYGLTCVSRTCIVWKWIKDIVYSGVKSNFRHVKICVDFYKKLTCDLESIELVTTPIP